MNNILKNFRMILEMFFFAVEFDLIINTIKGQ